MKHIFNSLLLLAAAHLLPTTALAHDFEVDGIYYNIINDNEVEVTFRGEFEQYFDYADFVTIPATVNYNGTIYSVTKIGENAFYHCRRLTNINIPISVKTIGGSAFEACEGLTSITIPNSVTTIGSYAFDHCSELKSIEIPNSVSTLSDFTFCSCSSLTSITIPNSVTTIGDYAFFECECLTELNIPNSVTTIGEGAYCACTSLTSINIPNSVTSIGIWLFYKCFELTSINVAADNPIYDSRNNCNAIIETASNTLINGCSNTIIPNSVTAIGEGAFTECSGLTNITIPNSVTTIGDYAFNCCYGLTRVNIPSSICYIGYHAFNGCDFLKDVYCYITDPSQISMVNDPDDGGIWDGSGTYTTLHVPSGSIEAYQADNRWWCFDSIVEIGNNISIQDTTVLHGETITIPVAMVNDQTMLAFQTDIFLPEGFTIVTDEDDEYAVTPSGRLTEDHIMMTQNVSNGAVRVMCYTPNALPIEGNEGDLFYITVQVPDDAAGDYTIYLRNTRLTTTDYTELRAPDAGAVLTVKTYIPGDVNDSRTVNVADIVVTAMYIMEMDPSPFIFDAADMNGDGEVTVTDVMLIARMILYPATMNAPRHAPAIGINNDCMSGEVITAGKTRKVSILLDNEMDYSAFQLDLSLPQGLSASNFQLTDRAGNHALDVNTLANGKTRVLCYTPAIEAISGHEGAVLTFDVSANSPVDGDITVDGIELVTTACQMVRLDAFTIGMNGATAVNEVVAGKTIARVDYYNVAGQRLAQPESGVTLVITTYTDGTCTSTKLIQ